MSSLRRVVAGSFLFVLALAVALTPSCGGGSGGDQTTKFTGAWTFQSGSLTPICPIPGLSPFDLTGLNVTFTKVDDATISLTINSACDLHFRAAGATATVLPNQTCTLDLGGALGPQAVAIKSWTLTVKGEEIDCTISGSASLCTASGSAVLVRGTTDAGVTPRDGGHDAQSGSSDAANEGGADAGTDAGATDGAAEAGADGGGEAGAETGAEAGGDAANEAASEAGAEAASEAGAAADGGPDA